MKYSYELYTEQIAQIRQLLINDIIKGINKAKALIIELNNPLIYNYIDDQFNEVICRVDAERSNVEIDDQSSGYNVELKDLSTEQLISILEAIQTEDIEVFEANDNETDIPLAFQNDKTK